MTSFESLWGQTATQQPPRRKKTFEEMWGETQEDEGLWETTKDIASTAYGAIPEPMQEGLESVGGGMLDVLHQLGRPQSAVAGGLYNIFEEMEDQAPEDERSAWNRYVTETFEAMGKGFTYEDEKRIQDIMAKANPEWVAENPILSTVLGFAGDVVTDPLNLIGLGLIRNAINVPVRGVAKVMEGTKLGAQLAEKADNPILRAFNVYTGDKKVSRDLYIKMIDRIRGKQGEVGRTLKMESREMREAAKALGISVKDLNRQILRETEGMAAAANVPSNLTGAARTKAQEEAKDMSEMFETQLTREQAGVQVNVGDDIMGPPAERVAPVEIGELDVVRGAELDLGRDLAGEAAERAPYVPHILAPGGEKALKKRARKIHGGMENMRDAYRQMPNAIRRDVKGTVEDVNMRYNTDFFLTDVPTIKAVRTAAHETSMASRDFLKQTAETLGRKTADAPAHWIPIKGVEGVVFDPKLAPFIDNMYKTVSDPKKLGPFLKMTDRATRWWKMWSLGLRPAYHARNVIGNLWNAYNIGGMGPTDAHRFGQAMKIQRQSAVPNPTKLGDIKGSVGFGKFSGKTDVGKFGSHSNEQLWKWAQEDGILNHGQYGADVGRNIERFAVNDAPKTAAARLAQWVTPTTKNKLLHGGFATGTALENNSRLALYLTTLAKTGSRQSARANVKKSLFDYADLSAFEQNTMKRWIPFYTWSRKNIPAQIEALIKNPQRGVKVDHMIDNIQYGVDTPSLEETSEFLEGRAPVFIDKFMEGGGGDVHNAITLMNWLPVVDPNRLLDWKPIRGGRFKELTAGVPFPTLLSEMTNPFFKSVLEGFMNYDIYRRRDISEYPGKKIDFLGMRMPVHIAKLAQNLVMLSELDRLNPDGMFGERTRKPDGEVVTTEAKFKPPWQDKPAWRESRIDQPVSVRLLQYLVGLRPYEDKGDAEMWRVSGLKKDIETLKSFARKEASKNNRDSVKDLIRRIDRVTQGM